MSLFALSYQGRTNIAKVCAPFAFVPARIRSEIYAVFPPSCRKTSIGHVCEYDCKLVNKWWASNGQTSQALQLLDLTHALGQVS